MWHILSFVIGQSNLTGFGFATLSWKLPYFGYNQQFATTVLSFCISQYIPPKPRREESYPIFLMSINYNIPHLHCTSSEVALEVSFPRLFLATHRYSPLSSLLTFVIINCCSLPENLILGLSLASTGDSFLVHDIVGTGLPVVLQDRVTLSPSVVVLTWERAEILGWSEKRSKHAVSVSN